MTPVEVEKPLLAAVRGKSGERPPIWIMRQAGRYLPEYRETRSRAASFLDLCYTPKLAFEVSMQPLRRFDLDAAILFSDILVIPDALGQKVRFETGEGPLLEPLDSASIGRLKPAGVLDYLSPVFETLTLIKAALPTDKTLIGFCGSPWTLASYMIGGGGSPDQAAARLFALRKPSEFAVLLELLSDVLATYLIAQFRAGADVVQLFESWALNLDETAFYNWVIAPNRAIVQKVRAVLPNAPIIGFPRGAAALVGDYAQQTAVDMVGLDYAMPIAFAGAMLPQGLGVQGNLDPMRLAAGGAQMEERVRQIIAGFKGRPHVFNLGHGILPQTPIENVSRLVELVKAG